MTYFKREVPISGGDFISVSYDGQRLVTGDTSVVRLWDAASMEQLRVLDAPEMSLNDLVISPDGRYVAGADSEQSRVVVWDADTGRMHRTLLGHEDMVLGLTFESNGLRLFSCGRDGVVIQWDVQSGRQLRKAVRGRGSLLEVALSSDDRLLATAGADGVVRVWDAQSLQEVQQYDVAPLTPRRVAFAPGEPYLVVTGEDMPLDYSVPYEQRVETGYAEVKTFHLPTQTDVGKPFLRTSRLWALTFVQPQVFVVGDWEGNMTMVSIPEGEVQSEFRVEDEYGSGHTINEMVWSPGGNMLLVSHSWGATVFQPPGTTPAVLTKDSEVGHRVLHRHDGEVAHLVFSEISQRLYSWGRDFRFTAYDLDFDELVDDVTVAETYLSGLALSPDQKTLYGALGNEASGTLVGMDGFDLNIRLVDRHMPAALRQIALSRDGRWMALGGMGKVDLYLQDASSKVIGTITLPILMGDHLEIPQTLAFDDTSKRLLIGVGVAPSELLIYDLTQKKFTRTWRTNQLSGPPSWVTKAKWFSTNTVAVGQGNGLIHILDTATGQELMKLDGHTDSIFGLAVMPDARALLSGSFDKTARLWDLASGQQRHRWTLDDSCLATVVTAGGAMFASTGAGAVVELMMPLGR